MSGLTVVQQFERLVSSRLPEAGQYSSHPCFQSHLRTVIILNLYACVYQTACKHCVSLCWSMT